MQFYPYMNIFVHKIIPASKDAGISEQCFVIDLCPLLQPSLQELSSLRALLFSTD